MAPSTAAPSASVRANSWNSPASTVQAISVAAVASVAPSAGVICTFAALCGASEDSSLSPRVPDSFLVQAAARPTAAMPPAVRAPRREREDRANVMNLSYTAAATRRLHRICEFHGP
jgi:hypothetical protein